MVKEAKKGWSRGNGSRQLPSQNLHGARLILAKSLMKPVSVPATGVHESGFRIRQAIPILLKEPHVARFAGGVRFFYFLCPTVAA